MAEQRPQPPEIRDSRRKFLVRSAKIGAAGLPLMATLHHRSALAQVCWGGQTTAGSMDLSGRHALSEDCTAQGNTLTQYKDPSYWPLVVISSYPNLTALSQGVTVDDVLGTTSAFGAGASGFRFGSEKVIPGLLVDYIDTIEAKAVQTLLNAYNAQEGRISSFAIPPDFAKVLIYTLFVQGDTNHSFNLPSTGNSISAFFDAINA